MAKDKSEDEAPIGAVRGDVRPVDVDDVPQATPTDEQTADAERRADLIETPEDEAPEGKDAPTTDHIPNYGATTATPGVPYSENPLNPGVNPIIMPNPGPHSGR